MHTQSNTLVCTRTPLKISRPLWTYPGTNTHTLKYALTTHSTMHPCTNTHSRSGTPANICTQSHTYLHSKEAVAGFSARLTRRLKSLMIKWVTSSWQRDWPHQWQPPYSSRHQQQGRTITKKVLLLHLLLLRQTTIPALLRVRQPGLEPPHHPPTSLWSRTVDHRGSVDLQDHCLSPQQEKTQIWKTKKQKKWEKCADKAGLVISGKLSLSGALRMKPKTVSMLYTVQAVWWTMCCCVQEWRRKKIPPHLPAHTLAELS